MTSATNAPCCRRERNEAAAPTGCSNHTINNPEPKSCVPYKCFSQTSAQQQINNTMSGRVAGPYLARMQGRAPHAARQARNGLGSASRPAYSSLLQKAAAHTACRRVMRLQAGLSGRPLYLAAVQGRVPRGSPSPRRSRLGHPACLYSSPRCKAAAQTTYRRMTRFRAGLPAGPYLAGVQGCAPYAARQARAAPAGLSGRPLPYRESKAECHAARQARGSGLATRPAYIARYDARLLPMHATYRR